MSNPIPPADRDTLLGAARAFASELRQKVDVRQAGVPTFADQVWLAFITHLEQGGPIDGADEREALARLATLLSRREQGRYVDYLARTASAPGTDVAYFDMVTSQGAAQCLEWKGRPLFKTVYDFSLYPMLLWALKPATILELGSGSGASAIWMADVAQAFGSTPRIHSVDLARPDVEDTRISFHEGDCDAIDAVLTPELLRDAAHPWLVVEDAHVNVYGVLRHLHPHTRAGDYVIVEDSAGKREEIATFLARHPGGYKVDTHYTDFFGRNATCAQDSIFVRTDG